MSEWQPIESIPKDRSILVLLEDGKQAVMAYDNDYEQWIAKGWEDCDYCVGKSRADIKPSCGSEVKLIIGWMELPKDPKKKRKECCKSGCFVTYFENGDLYLLDVVDNAAFPIRFCPYCGSKADE